MSSQINQPLNNDFQSDSTDERKYTRFGWLVIGIGLCGFLLWAAFAPLDKGVASPGSVTVSGNRKTIQSLVAVLSAILRLKKGIRSRPDKYWFK